VFEESGPTSEGTIYVFVDPGRTFQTLLGVGGALTDASAERSPGSRGAKRELLGITIPRRASVTLARTNISSCDF
jgi:glucosylceramidase